MRETIRVFTEWLILWPAEFAGILIGSLFHIAYILFGFAAALGVGKIVWELVPYKYARVAVALLCGVWVMMVLSLAEEHAITAAYHAMNSDSEGY